MELSSDIKLISFWRRLLRFLMNLKRWWR